MLKLLECAYLQVANAHSFDALNSCGYTLHGGHQWDLHVYGGGADIVAIVARTGMDKVTVSRAAIALTERGLFQRTPNLHDQRSHLLDLTPSGRALYRDVAPRALAVETRIFAGFSAEERQTLSRLLARAEAAALAGPDGA